MPVNYTSDIVTKFRKFPNRSRTCHHPFVGRALYHLATTESKHFEQLLLIKSHLNYF